MGRMGRMSEADLRHALQELQRDLETRNQQLTEARLEARRAQEMFREHVRIYNDSLTGEGLPTFSQWQDREKWNAATIALRREVDAILREPPGTKAEILARMRVALSEGSASWLKRFRAGKRDDKPT